jgi:hypothetical protein
MNFLPSVQKAVSPIRVNLQGFLQKNADFWPSGAEIRRVFGLSDRNTGQR